MKRRALTLFGGSGDLTYRKLLPALYNLESLGKLEKEFRIIALGRRDYTTEIYLEIAKKWIIEHARKQYDESVFQAFSSRLTYFKMDISQEKEYARLQAFYEQNQIEEHIYYYAVAPELFLPITKALKIHSSHNKAKVIIEKPFGEDLENARQLNASLAEFFGQKDIFHIDHYLGKEMIQNISALRFQNTVFAGIWNKDFIESIQIVAAEKEGIGTRAGYYDQTGAMKDMVQNHLLQVLSIVAMEEPLSHQAVDIHQEQFKVLQSLKPITDIKENLLLGQYDGYLSEPNIPPQSKTETFVALKLYIENERWQGVPFFICTGKKLKYRETFVVVRFKARGKMPPNLLILKIQPEEGVQFQFSIKKPGTLNEFEEICISESERTGAKNNTPEAYERLLSACFENDRSLFTHWEQIVLSWNYVNGLLEAYQKEGGRLLSYAPDTLGPEEMHGWTDWFKFC